MTQTDFFRVTPCRRGPRRRRPAATAQTSRTGARAGLTRAIQLLYKCLRSPALSGGNVRPRVPRPADSSQSF